LVCLINPQTENHTSVFFIKLDFVFESG